MFATALKLGPEDLESSGKVNNVCSCIISQLDPYEQLGISASTSYANTKKAFKREIAKPKDRALASLAYHMITSTDERRYCKVHDNVFKINEPDIFTFAAVGDTEKILAEISENPDLLNSVDEANRSLLYHTSRSGFYDATLALLEKGAKIDQKQAFHSTPLHGAAYYGHGSIVKLLLTHGADPNIKNACGNTPVDEASSPEILQIFEDHG